MGRSSRQTSMDYATPHRPALIRALNGMGRLAARTGSVVSLEKENLLQTAIRAEGNDDFGGDVFLTPLQVLLDAVENEAALHFCGRFITRQRLLNLLRTRLRVSRLLAANPGIRDLPLPRVVLITGLQRTGTTMLQRLLAADPENRALRSFEALNPAPLHPVPARDRAKKLRVARQAEAALSFLSADFFAIHPVEAQACEEDVLLLDYALISTVAESTMRVPTYARWVESNDNRPAYEYLKLLLQILSYGEPQQTWILKSPHHLEFLDPFFAVFPGATVVMTHRNPVQTLPSFCSMIWHGRGVFSDKVDPLEIGEHWLRKTSRMVRIGHETRARRTGDVFVDVQYRDLLKDPLSEIERIYQAAGRTLSPQARNCMIEAQQRNVQHRYGVHRYAMAPFGLSRDQIYAAYGSYVEQYCAGESLEYEK